jgi:hypothetical protein
MDSLEPKLDRATKQEVWNGREMARMKRLAALVEVLRPLSKTRRLDRFGGSNGTE